ncbi:DUF1697 domain-containing protein [Flavivirga aquimarina]|uniref:DUF1697 domain-containing protein n=1 Tax=Flavivirga aquimarina TaxID=2027862 RepID=A0ABT8W9P3_9FLAO|nr:DUF1697 domain-containing protein [Flavivirga aquimarina]MDO5969859.1 DUF1697 domain-containing protein [Flavivirga aquimarina]
MKTYIALLRGINVSGHRKVPMAVLRTLLSDAGLEHVQTYIQSGNVIFKSQEKDIQKLELKIHNAIKVHFGFEVPILVKTPEDLQRIFDNCPFPEENKINSYFTLLYTVPDKELIDVVAKITYPNETFAITHECVYFYCSIGYGKTKCSNNFFERKLKITATARNYKTMVKLLSLSQDI